MAKRKSSVPHPITKHDMIVRRPTPAPLLSHKQFFKEWRKYRNMTLEEAAPQANMTAGNLSAMERNAQGYTPEGLEALARVYETSPGWLLEVNPLDDKQGIIPVWDQASGPQKEMIIDLAKTVVKTGRQ